MDKKNLDGIIDWKLAKKLANGQMEIAKELFDLLLETLPEHREKLDHAFQKNDLYGLQQEAHKLHGATCYCGTPRLKEAAKELETAAKNNQNGHVIKTYNNLCAEISLIFTAKK